MIPRPRWHVDRLERRHSLDHARMLLVLIACLPYAMPQLPEDELRQLGHPAGRHGITRRDTPPPRKPGQQIPEPRRPLVYPALFEWAILNRPRGVQP